VKSWRARERQQGRGKRSGREETTRGHLQELEVELGARRRR
jgi:hypothetical protein